MTIGAPSEKVSSDKPSILNRIWEHLKHAFVFSGLVGEFLLTKSAIIAFIPHALTFLTSGTIVYFLVPSALLHL